MAIADGAGLPLAVAIASASPAEVTLVEHTLRQQFLRTAPERLIADRGYDSDPLDARLAQQGIELIAPHRSNRRRAPTQDGRPLRRYRRRWKIERLFAWLQNFRRLVTRYERHADNFLGMVQLGCIIILSRQFVG
jgi:transposase